MWRSDLVFEFRFDEGQAAAAVGILTAVDDIVFDRRLVLVDVGLAPEDVGRRNFLVDEQIGAATLCLDQHLGKGDSNHGQSVFSQ